jgi:hypothetical protein
MNEHTRTRVHPSTPKPTRTKSERPSFSASPPHRGSSSSKTEGKHQTAAEAIIKVAEAGIKSEKGFY